MSCGELCWERPLWASLHFVELNAFSLPFCWRLLFLHSGVSVAGV